MRQFLNWSRSWQFNITDNGELKLAQQLRRLGWQKRSNTLYQLCCGLQRHLRDNGHAGLNVFTDTLFKQIQDCLDAEVKRLSLTRLGVGSNIKEGQALSEDEENKLWKLGLLGDSSPRVLLDTMVFLIGKNFWLRSGKENRNLKFSQLTLEPVDDEEPQKLVYVSLARKITKVG